MSAFKKKPSFLVLGVMSGTSTDGLDLALCRFEKKGSKWLFSILKAQTMRYSARMKKFLQTASELSATEFSSANLNYGKFIAAAVVKFLADTSEMPVLIACHGHTIFHRPEKLSCFQLGHGGAIASLTGIACVNDFRLQDIILGGQGAPLVPFGDQALFPSYDACLNLGGIANISFQNKNQMLAFDIAPCNLPLNLAVSKLGKSYDKGGKIAASGFNEAGLFRNLNRLAYYRQQGPKSLGREWLEKDFMPIVNKYHHLKTQDLLASICEHVAFQTAAVINRHRLRKVLVTGGGAHHHYLIERIRHYSTNSEIIVPDKLTIDFKEALIFAFLGLCRWLSLPNTLPSVTGSKKASCSGSLWLP